MPDPQIVEGFVDFHVPTAGKPCQTWYKIIGDLSSPTACPVIALHGGPGMPHDYILAMAGLASSSSSYNLPMIFYDQIGTGRSTHLPEKMGDGAFWSTELFLRELDNLIAHLGVRRRYDVLGHSWGGMLAAKHAARRPEGLRRLVLASAPADMRLWVEAQNRLRGEMPVEVQEVMRVHEGNGTTEEKGYKDAVDQFYARHLCRVPATQHLKDAFKRMMEDQTVFLTMNGPNEFHFTGSLKDWSVVPELHNISVLTLMTNGRYDQAQDSVVGPLFREIPNVKWVQFAESGHMSHVEEPDRFLQVVGDFLTS